MQLRNSAERWGTVAQALHWIIVALIITQFALALYADSLPLGMAKIGAIARHKSFGITILAIAVLRLGWRVLQRESPLLPPDLPPWQRRIAGLTHFALYALLFALPLTGWAMSSARNYPVSWFSVLTLPDFVAPDETLYERLLVLHDTLAWVLAAIAALHAAAALYHHFIRKDAVLLRMLPFGSVRRTPE